MFEYKKKTLEAFVMLNIFVFTRNPVAATPFRQYIIEAIHGKSLHPHKKKIKSYYMGDNMKSSLFKKNKEKIK